MIFINLTNHPSSGWSEEQLAAARQYGEIEDIPFPLVDEQATEAEINRLADEYFNTIKSKGKVQDLTVHIMGEQTFCYALISKLQKEDIRCVASCTAHNTFVNEKGQKVSTFHFTRFREYVPPRSLRWWTVWKEKLRAYIGQKPFLSNKDYLSWFVLGIVLSCELLIVCYLHFKCPVLKSMAVVMTCLLPVSLLVGWLSGHRLVFRSAIVTKLLANAVTPTLLGTLYLLTFVIHIGWLTNAVLGLYTVLDDNFSNVLLSTIVCVVGLAFLVVFFPNGGEQKVKNPQKVFVSGISAISTNPDVLAKMTYDSLNLLPLARILQLADSNETPPQLVILQTDAFRDTQAQNDAFLHVLELVSPEARAKFDDCQTIDDKLRLLIREVAKKEFPDKAKTIDAITIEFTDACNYSKDFEKAYQVLESWVKQLDDTRHQLYFNLTPGTGIIGSLMTLMAIDGDRLLYYYSQEKMPDELTTPEEKRKFRESLLLPIDKKKIPLQALLSQALDKLS